MHSSNISIAPAGKTELGTQSVMPHRFVLHYYSTSRSCLQSFLCCLHLILEAIKDACKQAEMLNLFLLKLMLNVTGHQNDMLKLSS